MPTYTFRCEVCEIDFDRMLPLAQYKDPQSCDSGHPAKKLVTPVNFNLPGDDWASKNGRIAAQMRKKNERLTTTTNIMKREAPLATLVPNVGGEQVGSWKEAQSLAASQGKDTTSYEPMVKKEVAKS